MLSLKGIMLFPNTQYPLKGFAVHNKFFADSEQVRLRVKVLENCIIAAFGTMSGNFSAPGGHGIFKQGEDTWENVLSGIGSKRVDKARPSFIGFYTYAACPA